ncbi:MAG: hypothetical protein V4507_01140 [Verrucomicrobiota bacterium]
MGSGQYLDSYSYPFFLYLIVLACFSVVEILGKKSWTILSNITFCFLLASFLGLISASVLNLIKKRWKQGLINALFILVSVVATAFVYFSLMFATLFGPSEDGFADHLKIPEGIEIYEPEESTFFKKTIRSDDGGDEFQNIVRKALEIPGTETEDFVPKIPSLREAVANNYKMFNDYIEACPEWGVFSERGNRFAARRWSYGGEPQDELHGYISNSYNDSYFQTRCLLCLSGKQWSSYFVQSVEEGDKLFKPSISIGNNLQESRVMIQCGAVSIEIFEQSNKPERRITKATITALENEFSEFQKDPQSAIERARERSRKLVESSVDSKDFPIRLRNGMQPGIYEVTYSINAGEAGEVYLKAFEVTKETPLSVERLREKSETRVAWSDNATERFGAKAGFSIYEGDWGKPYAARFEVWFKPDSEKPERKLGERIYKIEGWQR